MKKTALITALFGAFLYFQTASAQQEVIATKENVTVEEVINQLNKLVGSDKEEDKALLQLEAEALAKHTDEDLIGLAATLYERFLDDEELAKEIRSDIEKKFPQGKTARSKAYSKIFQSEDENRSATELEAQYNEWVQQFPASNFEEKDRNIYSSGKIAVAVQYAKENNQAKAQELVQGLKGTEFYVAGVNNVYSNIPAEGVDYTRISPLIKDAYEVAKSASESTDEALKNGNNSRYFASITPIYAEVLSHTGDLQEAIAITSTSLESTDYTGYTALKNTKTLAQAYLQTGDKQKALDTYEKFIVANGKEESIVAATQTLYAELNGTDFDTHLANLEKQATEALFAKYKKDMIKKEAPGFTLVNRDGKEVSLADYKGKVVILDFWATWCGPCIVSFPGMQAAVNKYAADPEVEFLFIDTWQNEENYKELVENFITENNYNFHVLFDEMKDRSAAVVTAYEVKGIPTKVVIDKDGFIRFHNSGSETNVDKLVKELDTKIALAKGE